MFSVKVDVVHGLVELHLGGTLTENQLSDFAQELKAVFSSSAEPPIGALFERKAARPLNQHVASLLSKVFEIVQSSGAQRVADVGPATLMTAQYDERCRRFDSEEEARRWLVQASIGPLK
jgi:hypothetical protein